MNDRFFQDLENRTMLSGVMPTAAWIDAEAPAAAVMGFQPTAVQAAALPKLLGTFTGTVQLKGDPPFRITLKITSQSNAGALVGQIRSPDDPSLKLSLTGTVNARRKVTLTLSGRNSDGRLTAQMSGSLSADGKLFKGSVSGKQGSDKFSGTFQVTRK